MGGSLVARIVGFSSRYSGLVVLAILLVAFAAGHYVRGHFAMNSRTEELISPQTQWRKREAVYDKAFPQQSQLIVAVVDGVTPELADAAAHDLTTALAAQKTLLPSVRQPDGGEYFTRDGLMLLSTATVKQTTQQLISAQPFLGALAVDPSLRGIADNLSTALLGVQHGQAKLEDLDGPMAALARTFDGVLAGQPTFLSWRSLVTGTKPGLRETRRFIEIRPRLDYRSLMPGQRATKLVRETAERLKLTPQNGVRVRLTGTIPMADDEFGSLTQRARLMATLMMVAVLTMLWFALRSTRLIFAVLLTVFVGLTLTTAAGLFFVGAFNLISVAFIALFVGLGVDFGIQFCVRYREERFRSKDLDLALLHTGAGIGSALALAAAATAAGFYSFLPTSYRGVAELGFVAGTGMIVTFVLSITFLPGVVKLLSPLGEAEEIGFQTLVPLDRMLQKHKRRVVLAALIIGIAAAACLPAVKFDFNPLDLRDPHVESVATALDLMKNPDTSPNTLDILTPSHDAAVKLAARLAKLPEVSRAMTIDSFVPDDQTQKLALINDANTLLDPTINPFMTKPPPSDAEVVESFKTVAEALRKAAGNATSKAANHARMLASALERLAKADKATLARAENAVVPGLKTMLDEVRASLRPYPVTAQTLPPDLRRDWISPTGLYRIEVYSKSTATDNDTLRKFTRAVQKIAPGATGEPLLIQESGRTIVRAFLQAGILSFIVITILLLWELRNVALVALALGPLVLAGIATLATCVVIGLQLNYANIIALPLLLGIGVAFDIYFVMAWRSGMRELLSSPLTRAVILSAGTTASAFGTLWISSHPGTASMGELLAISLAWILAIVLFLLPPLLGYAVPNIGLNTPAPRQAARADKARSTVRPRE
jgi:hopanoid biosynthesis associated RND transporter like protein HpnN